MTTLAPSAGRTIDRLAIPKDRSIETVWETDKTNDDGRVLLILSTKHDPYRKQITSTLHTATLRPSGYLMRKIVMYGPASTDRGKIVGVRFVSRFSQKQAREQHIDATILLNSGKIGTMNAAEVELVDLFKACVGVPPQGDGNPDRACVGAPA